MVAMPILWVTLSPTQGFLWAEEIAVEPFDYEPGELDQASGGSGWESDWSAMVDLSEIVNTEMDPLLFDVPGGDAVSDGFRALELLGNADAVAVRRLTLDVDLDKVCVSLLFRFEGNVDDNDFLGIWFDNTTGGDHTLVPTIGLKANHGNGTGPEDLFCRLQLNAEAYTEDLIPGDTYFVVGCLSKDVDDPFAPYVRYEMWVNPAVEEVDSPRVVAVGLSLTSFELVGFRVPNFEFEDRVLIANLRIGTAWEDVVPTRKTPRKIFVRGDSNGDGNTNLTDAVFVLLHLFRGGDQPPCRKSADSDDDGRLQLTDAVYLLNYLFRGGPAPPTPWGECGADLTLDALTCESYPGC